MQTLRACHCSSSGKQWVVWVVPCFGKMQSTLATHGGKLWLLSVLTYMHMVHLLVICDLIRRKVIIVLLLVTPLLFPWVFSSHSGVHLWLAVGTIIHTITQQNYHTDFYYADNVFEPQMKRFCGAAFDVKPGAHVLQDSQCTPDAQLFFQLGSAPDPLAVCWEGLTCSACIAWVHTSPFPKQVTPALSTPPLVLGGCMVLSW